MLVLVGERNKILVTKHVRSIVRAARP
jgi:hypothetical protein